MATKNTETIKMTFRLIPDVELRDRFAEYAADANGKIKRSRSARTKQFNKDIADTFASAAVYIDELIKLKNVGS